MTDPACTVVIDRDRPAIYYLPPIKIGDTNEGHKLRFVDPCTGDYMTYPPGSIARATIHAFSGALIYEWSSVNANLTFDGVFICLHSIPSSVAATLRPGLHGFELAVIRQGVTQTLIADGRVSIRGRL
ncbi:hypothetical protein [Nevskia ramosa]|uniref:hypothetical protein n=1 Tax=Nevskia ramosa TaxID=64002 RepID=UPI003D1013CD